MKDNYHIRGFVPDFANAVANAPLPAPGGDMIISCPLNMQKYNFRIPPDDRPSGVDVEPLFLSLGVANTLRVLAGIMLEQRVVFIASRVGKLSECAHAALSLIYPLHWQHIFIPILPPGMISYVCAPMPFVVGVLSNDAPKLESEPMDAAIFIDLDRGRITGDAEMLEAAQLPRLVREPLEKALSKLLRARPSRGVPSSSPQLDSSAIADTVVGLLMVRLLGHYVNHVDGKGGNERLHPDFDDEGFIQAAPTPIMPFLRTMRSSQLFEHWICDQITMVAETREKSAFEYACVAYAANPGEMSPEPSRRARAKAIMAKAAQAANQAALRASERAVASSARVRSSAAPSLRAVALAAQQRAQLAQAKAMHAAASVKHRLQSPEFVSISREGIWRERAVEATASKPSVPSAFQRGLNAAFEASIGGGLSRADWAGSSTRGSSSPLSALNESPSTHHQLEPSTLSPAPSSMSDSSIRPARALLERTRQQSALVASNFADGFTTMHDRNDVAHNLADAQVASDLDRPTRNLLQESLDGSEVTNGVPTANLLDLFTDDSPPVVETTHSAVDELLAALGDKDLNIGVG